MEIVQNMRNRSIPRKVVLILNICIHEWGRRRGPGAQVLTSGAYDRQQWKWKTMFEISWRKDLYCLGAAPTPICATVWCVLIMCWFYVSIGFSSCYRKIFVLPLMWPNAVQQHFKTLELTPTNTKGRIINKVRGSFKPEVKRAQIKPREQISNSAQRLTKPDVDGQFSSDSGMVCVPLIDSYGSK